MFESCSVKPENKTLGVVSPLQELIAECRNIASAGFPPLMKYVILASRQTTGKNASSLEISLHFKYSLNNRNFIKI